MEITRRFSLFPVYQWPQTFRIWTVISFISFSEGSISHLLFFVKRFLPSFSKFLRNSFFPISLFILDGNPSFERQQIRLNWLTRKGNGQPRWGVCHREGKSLKSVPIPNGTVGPLRHGTRNVSRTRRQEHPVFTGWLSCSTALTFSHISSFLSRGFSMRFLSLRKTCHFASCF